MANFDSGVKRYIKARAVIEVNFPVDFRDNASIACVHCKYYRSSLHKCGINDEIVNYPERYVGEFCPLEEVTEDV